MNPDYIYYKSKLISTLSLCELDYDLEKKFGFDYEIHDDIIEIQEGNRSKQNTYEATPIEIDEVIRILEEQKNKGANYVEIEAHCDHRGYEFSFLKIGRASRKDIEKCVEKERKEAENALKLEKNELKERLKLLEELMV